MYCAPWVVPVSSAPIRDGAVLVEQDRIVSVGPSLQLLKSYPGVARSACSGVLLPAFVNAHIHLELSIYGPLSPEHQGASMCDWISSLLAVRQEADYSEAEIAAAATASARDQFLSGVGLMLDIGNGGYRPPPSCGPEILSLLEMLAPTVSAEEVALAAVAQRPQDLAITGHAPYSTGPRLLSSLKRRSLAQGQLFSLHLAEVLDESLLLTQGRGCFAKFLKDRGAFDGTFPVSGIDTTGVVGYLEKLGVLDEWTLCVHSVHLSRAEIERIAVTGANICLCPGSNRFLSVGVAPLEAFLAHKILPALGTDSITSNTGLDIWAEMALLRQSHPGVGAATILRMATLGGARALHREGDFGSLEEGKKARILHVHGLPYEDLNDAAQLLDCLTGRGRPGALEWLASPN